MTVAVSWGAGSWLDAAVKIVAILASIGTAVGAWFAVRAYRQSVQLKRSEWLQKLYQQFYEQERYREIRELLDYRPDRELQHLYRQIADNERDVWTDRLWDYLNFFEFVEALVELKQITADDRNRLFEYPLKKISDDDLLHSRLQQDGFELLYKFCQSHR